MAAYGVSEPGAGSDVAAITTRAVKEEGGYRITGQKCWITVRSASYLFPYSSFATDSRHDGQNGGVSNWMFVLAKTDPSAKPHKSLSGFIVDSDSPGITVESKLVNLGQRCSDTRIISAFRPFCSLSRLFSSRLWRKIRTHSGRQAPHLLTPPALPPYNHVLAASVQSPLPLLCFPRSQISTTSSSRRRICSALRATGSVLR